MPEPDNHTISSEADSFRYEPPAVLSLEAIAARKAIELIVSAFGPVEVIEVPAEAAQTDAT